MAKKYPGAARFGALPGILLAVIKAKVEHPCSELNLLCGSHSIRNNHFHPAVLLAARCTVIAGNRQ